MSVNMGDKITVTALQLLYIIERAIDDALDEYECTGKVESTVVATQATVDFFKKHRKDEQA